MSDGDRLVCVNLMRRTAVGTWDNATPLYEYRTVTGTARYLNKLLAEGWELRPLEGANP